MKYILFVVVLWASHAHAGFGAVCRSIFSGLVAEDPYQFEQVVTDALVTYYEQYGIKGAWGTLTPREAETMNIMGGELRWRLGPVMIQFENPAFLPRVETALEAYSQFEGYAQYAKGRN